MRAYDVLLNGLRVGHLTEMTDGRVAFRFVEEYKRLAPRLVLSQFFEDDLDRVYRSKRGVLPAFFANLIPEGQLREIIETSLGLGHGDSLALLAAVSTDLPGAIELKESGVPVELQMDGEENGDVIGHESNGHDAPDSTPPEVELRFSLAGVQMKFSLMRDHEKLTLPARGARGEWIVKLDSSGFPRVIENEFATLQWARAAGFDVPACYLLPLTTLPEPLRKYSGESKHVLAIERYDRVGQRRIPQEDFAQIVGLAPSLKYDQITYAQCAAIVRNVVGEVGYHEFISRLTFIVASGNADAHLKNWSLLYPDGVRPVLTPLYDQVATVAWPDVAFKLALKFAGARDFLQVSEDAFARLAVRAGADPRATVATMNAALARIVAAWRTASISDALPAGHAAALRAYWLRSPLLKRFIGDLFSSEGAG